MSADFLFITLPKCRMTPSRLRQARKLLRQLPEEELLSTLAAAQRSLKCYGAGDFDGRADVATAQLGPTNAANPTYYLTGGMSCGDSPTAAFTDIKHLEPLWGQLNAWASEDAASGIVQPNAISRSRPRK